MCVWYAEAGHLQCLQCLGGQQRRTRSPGVWSTAAECRTGKRVGKKGYLLGGLGVGLLL